ncbi:MAG: hypothetical protein JWN86_1737 [Planctomycetota bacterium]|nr:hypothetical protein [Planctomycetota bacterium]
MTPLFALVRKQLVESRWLLGISAVALFGLIWLFVFATNRMENMGRARGDEFAQMRRQAMSRGIGGASADGSSTSLEIMWWRHPFVVLIIAMWPIARGSAAVGGELEKGSLDLVLSRPISRNTFLTAQVLTAFIGIAILAGAMVGGILVGNRFNFIEAPPSLMKILFPCLNVMAFAVAIFGYAFFFSSMDIVRWRPNLVASTLTLAMFIANIIANVPVLENWKWLEKVSIFTAYDPVESALRAARLPLNVEILGGIGLAGLILGYVAFNLRDLPANS